MTAATAYSIYSKNNIEIESPEKLVEMMYEGIIKFSSQAIKAIEADDIEGRIYAINRTIPIFLELLNTLDIENGGDVALYLRGLYSQQIKFLAEANLESSKEKLETVIKVTRGLLEAWRETTAR